MSISETEIRSILTIARNLVKVLEHALKSEQEKNEIRLSQQLAAQGINVKTDEDLLEVLGTDEWRIGVVTNKPYSRRDDGSWRRMSGRIITDKMGRFIKYDYEFVDDTWESDITSPESTDAFEL